MGNGGMWATYALFAALAVVPAILNSWRPWEIVALVTVLAIAGAITAAAWAWRAARVREIELTALTSDDQAARLLGEALGKCGPYLTEAAVKEIWGAFAALPSESKRALALAIVGLLAEADSYESFGFGTKVAAVARGFYHTTAEVAPAIASDEQAARVFGEAVGRCLHHLSEAQNRELWDRFAALPPGARRELASALAGFVAAVDFNYDGVGEKALALAQSFCADELLTPDRLPAHAP